MSGPPPGNGPRGPGRDSSGPVPAQDLRSRSGQSFDRAPVLLAILGPTGTGKSELAYELALRLDGEIVNCDALQVYRGFDAATAKPPVEHRRRVPHHGVDCVEPECDFNLAEFEKLASEAISQIAGRGRVAIVAGGTGMYLRGLLRGILGSPVRDDRLRARIHAIAARRGAAALHRWLARLDAESAARLPPGDVQRLARALEFVLLGGGSWSERLRAEGTWQKGCERFRTLKIGLGMERERLYRRLNARVDRFFEGGLIDEVRRLLASGVPPSANAFKAIGYREVLSALQAGRDAEVVREDVKRNTRRFAKRQMTWFRREPGVVWLDADPGTGALADEVQELWRRHVASDA